MPRAPTKITVIALEGFGKKFFTFAKVPGVEGKILIHASVLNLAGFWRANLQKGSTLIIDPGEGPDASLRATKVYALDGKPARKNAVPDEQKQRRLKKKHQPRRRKKR